MVLAKYVHIQITYVYFFHYPSRVKDNDAYSLKGSFIIMKVFQLDIPSDWALTDFDLISYIGKLGIAYFWGVFMQDELSSKKHLVECGIMNFNKRNEIGSHWVCLVQNHNVWIYFDIFGQITPLSLQRHGQNSKTKNL